MNDPVIAPKSTEKSIQEYLRTYYSRIRSGEDFPVSLLFNAYLKTKPSLHKLADSPLPDISALNYAISRLPAAVFTAKKIIFAASVDQAREKFPDITSWQIQGSPGRRRLNYYDPQSGTLVVLVNSDSDLDDFVNCLVAFSWERQKFSRLNQKLFDLLINTDKFSVLGLSESDWYKFRSLFGPDWTQNLFGFHFFNDIILNCLPLDDSVFSQNVSKWWQQVISASYVFNLPQMPVYFVSSNLHSLTNLIGGFPNLKQDEIINFIEKFEPDLYHQWQELKVAPQTLRVIDFLYYISGKYLKNSPAAAKAKADYEASLGIKPVKVSSQIPCDVQLIPVSAIAKSGYHDPNLIIPDSGKLLNSRSYIINIEYPLGMGAYFILTELLKHFTGLRGIYIIGKAAILAGAVGDIQVPNVVFDERSNNILYPQNIFNSYFPFPAFQSSILQDQKAISVYGTFLENESQLKNYTQSGFNIIEMESGPYLSAILKHRQDWNAMPHDQVAHLDKLPFDLGIINYASDNPLSQTLGEGTMSLKGVEPTYLAVLSSIQRIIDLESV